MPANVRAHPQPGLLLMIIEPKPIRGGNGQKPDVAGCRVERGLFGTIKLFPLPESSKTIDITHGVNASGRE